MKLAAAYFRRDLADDLAYPLSFLIELADALVLLAGVFLLSRGIGPTRLGGYDPFAFLFAGLAVNAALGVCLTAFSLSLRGARSEGMLRATLIMPATPVAQILSASAYPFARAILDAAMHLTAALLLGLSLSRANVPAALLVFVLALAAASAVGIVSAAFAVLFKRGDPLLWLIGVAGLVLGGVFYPIDQLPAVLRAAAWITPVAPALAAMRPLLLDGAPIAAVLRPVIALAMYAGVGLPLSLFLFTAAVQRARRRGTIRET